MSYGIRERLRDPRPTGPRTDASKVAFSGVQLPGHGATAAALLTLALSPVAEATDGALDPTFGVSDGVRCIVNQRVMTCDVADAADQLFGMGILLDGRIVAGGRASGAPDVHGDFVVARFSEDGGLDTSFGIGGPDGINGLETTSLDPLVDQVGDLVIQADSKIVVVGTAGPEGPPDLRRFAVARYTAAGTLDTGFADQGIATPSFPGGGPSSASAVAIQPADQKIVVALRSENPSSGDFVLARLTPQGQLDPSFDGDGLVQTSFPDSQREAASAVLVQPDGKIVAGGRAGPSTDSAAVDFALVRYNQDGSLDDGSANDTTHNDSFGIDGRVRTDFGLQRIEGVVALSCVNRTAKSSQEAARGPGKRPYSLWRAMR